MGETKKKVVVTVGPGMVVVVKHCADVCEPKMCVKDVCEKPAAPETPAKGECEEKKEEEEKPEGEGAKTGGECKEGE